ncbi:required for drug-induced death protein 1 [Scomber japonicus]|uniref:required for drug-induced death protein 1 n=1 Tax=Scomber japonicus TaxID=13676 RepID=UPI002306BD63|nr:required for drug-induced death protein 1 [Scomber japonicus]
MGAQEGDDSSAPPAERKTRQKTSKEVYFSVLPDKYEPLIEEEEEEEEEETPEERKKRKEEKKRKKKKKYKKYRKNVRKALCFSWRCLMVGLQSFASTYSTPLSAMATVVTETQRAAGQRA